MGHNEHDHGPGHDHHGAHDVEEVAIAVLTVSTSRTLDTDSAGDAIVSAIDENDDTTLTDRRLVGDDPDAIESALRVFETDSAVDAVITTGGTGITPDDNTTVVAKALFAVELPGFGEHFRRLSIEEVGTRAIATRATAGVCDPNRTLVFCLPGSEAAARLGTEAIVLPEVTHLVAMATR